MQVEVRTGEIDEAVALSRQIPEFHAPYDSSEYERRLGNKGMVLIAASNETAVGFKVGYDRYLDNVHYYSWFGGVTPAFRRLGIARLLQERMETQVRKMGYRILRFKTLNKHRNMIHFALDSGFYVYSFKEMEDPMESKIYFEKRL